MVTGFDLTRNNLLYGDNLEILRAMPAEVVDLCYIDPPFNSKRNYFQIYNGIHDEVDPSQSQAFMDSWRWGTEANHGLKLFSDPQNLFADGLPNLVLNPTVRNLIHGLHGVLGDTGLMAYLVSLTLRIAAIHRVLKPTGSFYLHCDPMAGHYLKLICDAIFCAKPREGQFLNEIIWCYKSGGASKKRFSRKHDLIFFYSRSKDYRFNFHTEKSYNRGLKPYRFKGVEEFKDELGWHTLVGIKDYWNIDMVGRTSAERLGYPTQKPEALLERIIRASSNPGDLVLDAYCGCGTTVAVAERLGRRWVGIDSTYQSIGLILKRLKNSNLDNWPAVEKTISLSGVPQDLESARALANHRDARLHREFEKWAVLTYTDNQAQITDAAGESRGIDGVTFFSKARDSAAEPEPLGKVIIQVKSGKVGVKAIRDLIGVCAAEAGDVGILITLEPPTADMIQAAERAGHGAISVMTRDYPAIQIVTISELMAGERLKLPLVYDVVTAAQKLPEQHQNL
ncbi:MAG: DNA methyltransferase [Alphaproteobacteria bacterium]|nr:DNA methyltransferase [Alphaproteobacteria bacterium]